MKILLVNDDGYQAEGIKILEDELKEYGEVYVVAPYEYMSGKSIGLTIYVGFKTHKIDDHHFAIEGTPADCTAYGLCCLGQKFDLVVSGINDGLNITYDIMHSGTIGACVEALQYGVPAVAFSHNHNPEFVKPLVKEAFDWVLKNNLISTEHIVNINFPRFNEYKGIKLAKVLMRHDNRYFDVEGDMVTPKRVMDDHSIYDKESEIFLVNDGYCAVSLLVQDLYREDKYEQYKKIIKE